MEKLDPPLEASTSGTARQKEAKKEEDFEDDFDSMPPSDDLSEAFGF